jgi:hypothetical protein
VRIVVCARHMNSHLEKVLAINSPTLVRIVRLTKSEAFKCSCGQYARWYIREVGK